MTRVAENNNDSDHHRLHPLFAREVARTLIRGLNQSEGSVLEEQQLPCGLSRACRPPPSLTASEQTCEHQKQLLWTCAIYRHR